jgi:hypothetical protein
MDEKKAVLSGPMFRQKSNLETSSICEHIHNKSRACFSEQEGGHYNHFAVHTETALELLRRIFPTGEANELSFALFSTSGVHGSYSTIEDVEKEGGELTFVIIQPRLCTLHYGNCEPKNEEDFMFLKKLRKTSWQRVLNIGLETK